jgi:hypothetical protein
MARRVRGEVDEDTRRQLIFGVERPSDGTAPAPDATAESLDNKQSMTL